MILLATVAGAAGALSRYLLSGYVQGRFDSDLPIGTLAVNLVGAFLLGSIVGVDQLESVATFTAAGFLGGFTTFSTWIIETVRLDLPLLRARALANLTVTLVAGVALAAAGYSLTN